MKNLNNKLKELKERIKELEKIVSISFQTSENLDKNYKNNKNYFDEYDYTLNKIRQLEWELMTPEEQARDLEVRRLIKLKTGQIKEE